MKKKYESSWLQLVVGIIMVLAGILSFFDLWAFGRVLAKTIPVIVILSGILSLIFYFINRKNPWVPTGLLISGILNILLGILLFFTGPLALGLTFAFIIAIWFVGEAISQIVSAFQLKKIGFSQWWLHLILGILEIILAILCFASPGATLIFALVYVGVYLLIGGIVRIVNFISHR